DLVQDGDPDLALQLGRIGERRQERAPVDDDLPGQRARGRAVRVRVSDEAAEDRGVVRALLLDDDRDVLEPLGDVVGERVERGANVVVEFLVGHQYLGRKGARTLNRRTVSTPN